MHCRHIWTDSLTSLLTWLNSELSLFTVSEARFPRGPTRLQCPKTIIVSFRSHYVSHIQTFPLHSLRQWYLLSLSKGPAFPQFMYDSFRSRSTLYVGVWYHGCLQCWQVSTFYLVYFITIRSPLELACEYKSLFSYVLHLNSSSYKRITQQCILGVTYQGKRGLGANGANKFCRVLWSVKTCSRLGCQGIYFVL